MEGGEWVEEDGGGREEAKSGEAEVETKGAGGDKDEDSEEEEEESGRKGGGTGGGEKEEKKADVEMNLLLAGTDDAAATEKKKGEEKGVAPSSPPSPSAPSSPAKSKSKLSLWRKVAGVAKTGMLTDSIGSPVDELLSPSSPGMGGTLLGSKAASRPRRPASGWRPQTIEFLEKCSLVVEVHSAMDVPIADASGTLYI